MDFRKICPLEQGSHFFWDTLYVVITQWDVTCWRLNKHIVLINFTNKVFLFETIFISKEPIRCSHMYAWFHCQRKGALKKIELRIQFAFNVMQIRNVFAVMILNHSDIWVFFYEGYLLCHIVYFPTQNQPRKRHSDNHCPQLFHCICKIWLLSGKTMCHNWDYYSTIWHILSGCSLLFLVVDLQYTGTLLVW